MQQFARHSLWQEIVHRIVTLDDHGAATRVIDAEIVHRPIGKRASFNGLTEDLHNPKMAVIVEDSVINLFDLLILSFQRLHEVTTIMHLKAGNAPLVIVGFRYV